MRPETHLIEMADVFVDLEHGIAEDTAVLTQVQSEQLTVCLSQSHQASKPGSPWCHFTGLVVGVVVEVIAIVQIGAIVSVGLNLLGKSMHAKYN